MTYTVDVIPIWLIQYGCGQSIYGLWFHINNDVIQPVIAVVAAKISIGRKHIYQDPPPYDKSFLVVPGTYIGFCSGGGNISEQINNARGFLLPPPVLFLPPFSYLLP